MKLKNYFFSFKNKQKGKKGRSFGDEDHVNECDDVGHEAYHLFYHDRIPERNS